MADIKLDIEVNGTRQLQQAADQMLRTGNVSRKLAKDFSATAAANARLVKETRRVEAVKKQLRKAVQDDIISANQATRALNEEIRKSKERVLTDKTLIDQAKKRAKAAADLKKETDRLTKAYAPARVAADLYQTKVREINQAQRRGIITQKEAQQSLALLTKEYYDFTQGAATGGNQFAKFNVETYKANQRLKRFTSTGLQQAGYQFGDFAVQVQSGTNVAVAFGQQMSQLLGIFGAGGALAGAGVAIATAFIAPLIDAKREAEGLDLNLSEVFSTLQENQTSLKQLIETSFVGPLEQARLKAVAVLEAFKVIDLRETQRAVAKDILPILEGLDKISEAASKVAGDDGALFGLIGGREEGARNAAADIAKEIDLLIAKIGQAARGPAEELPKNLVEAFQALESSGTASDELLKSFKELLESSGAFAAYQQEILDAAEAEANAKNEQNRKDEEFIKIAIKNAKERAEAEKKRLEERAKFNSRTAQNEAAAANKLRVVQEKANAAALAFIKRRRNESILALGEEADQLISNANQALDLDEKVAAEKRSNAIETANFNFSLVEGLLVTLQKEQEELNKSAEKLGERLGIGYAKALEIIRQAQAEATVGLDAFGGAGDFKYSVPTTFKPETEKTTKRQLKNIQDTIDALKEQTAQERKLLGLTGERLKEEEIFYDLVQANKDADIKLSEEKLRAVAKEIAAQKQANEMYEKAIGFVDGMTDAFSDFIANGLDDFKSFVSSIKDMFIRLLADLIAQAAANRILIPITAGFMASAGGAAAGTAMGTAVGAGGIGASLAMGAYGLGAGASAALGIGGYTSAGLFNVSANAAVATAAGASPVMATIGAAIPPLIAVAAVIGLLTKKTKVLDTGLRATVEGFDVAIQSFQVTQTSRLFGILKGKKVTSYGAAPSAIAAPIVEAIGGIQQSVLDAAKSLGIGTGLFEDFSYKFQLSLQGLTEEQKMEKLNEELSKMGDAFASLSGHFETMNELLQVAQQRYDLETRLLTLLNDQSALLTRQRQIERATTHELNQSTLDQIYALEDAYRGVNTAFATAQRSIEARKKAITNSFNEVMESIQSRVQAASQAVSLSQSILSSLQSAAGRGIGMSREAGLSYLRSLTGQARITDQEALSEALSAVGEPTEDLFSSFVDYQREFADQSNLIRDLEEKAGKQLSADEKLLKQLQEQERATEGRHNAQLSALDAQLSKAQAQIDALNNVDTSVKSVSEAMSDLAEAIKSAQAAQETAKASSAAATGGGSKAVAQFGGDLDLLSKYDMGSNYTRTSDNMTFDRIKLTGASQLLDAASMVGVSTTGKTGAQISQDIANAGYVAVNLDSATKAQQFALGGYHSGGLRMVGERGPELEATGPSRVYSANQTRRMMQNPDLVEAVKAMKEEIVELRNEQRQLGINNNKYTKRTYDLYRQWDTEGLPAERT